MDTSLGETGGLLLGILICLRIAIALLRSGRLRYVRVGNEISQPRSAPGESSTEFDNEESLLSPFLADLLPSTLSGAQGR